MADYKKCMIIGASPYVRKSVFDELNLEEYFIICADAGLETAQKFGVTPHLVVGDFDSLNSIPNSKDFGVKVLPKEKDITDSMYAAMYGLAQGFRQFILVGCFGGKRADHTIANYNVMLYLSRKGANSIMLDNVSKTFLLSDSRLRISDQKGCIVSVFPFGTNMCNLSYRGLKYGMSHGDLMMGDTLMGVSNEIIEDSAEIEVHAGYAMIIVYNEPEN